MAQDSNVTESTGSASAAQSRAQSTELPDSPSTALAQASSQPQTSQTPSQQQSQPTQQDQSAPAPARKQEPVGTAAAEAPKTTGVAASQPAGLAIAAAKQRRARKIIIRTGAIIGAGIAVGTVIALTEATSSKPPGAR